MSFVAKDHDGDLMSCTIFIGCLGMVVIIDTLSSVSEDMYKEEFMDLRIGVIGSGGRGAIAAYAHHPAKAHAL
jgi:hypothetical protein